MPFERAPAQIPVLAFKPVGNRPIHSYDQRHSGYGFPVQPRPLGQWRNSTWTNSGYGLDVEYAAVWEQEPTLKEEEYAIADLASMRPNWNAIPG